MYRRIVALIVFVIVVIVLSLKINFDDLSNNELINVEVKGEVLNNAVYEVKKGTSLGDLLKHIELNKDADLSGLSLNEIIYNNQIINIPKVVNYELISINNANIQVLSSLPGIGKTTAEKIIEYRNTFGSFTSLEDLKNVSGIGDKKYEKLKQYICL